MKLSKLLTNLTGQGSSRSRGRGNRGLAQDSRQARPGDLFVAVKGLDADGHDFIPDAIRRGAVAVVGGRA
jgi:UDP-N-acetylmuramoyl-L-alanyl-D-glutamate--2,6-diaminopimelate ligase